MNNTERSSNRRGEPFDIDLLVKQRRRDLIRSIIEDCFLILACLTIMLYCSALIKISFYYWVGVMCIALGVKCICKTWPKSPCDAIIYISFLFGSICRIMVLCFVGIKIDHILDWGWASIIWPYWLSFALLFVFSLFCLILFLNAVFQYFQDEVSYHAIVGSLWCFICLGGFTVTSFLSALYFVRSINKMKEGEDQMAKFINLFLPMMVYTICMIAMSILFWKPLISWWDYFLYGDEPFSQIEIEDFEENLDQEHRQMNTFQPKAPMFIQRISETLFARASKKKKRRRNPKKSEHLDSNREESKEESRRRNRPAQRFGVKYPNDITFDTIPQMQRSASCNRFSNKLKGQVNLDYGQTAAPNFERQISKETYSNGSRKFKSTNRDFVLESALDRKLSEEAVRNQTLQQIYHRNRKILKKTKGDPLNKLNKKNQRDDINQSESESKENHDQVLDEFDGKCTVCYEKKQDAVFTPCGHGGFCYEHAIKYITENEKCHFCRKDVQAILKIDIDAEHDSQYIKVLEISTFEDELDSKFAGIDKEVEESKGYNSDDQSSKISYK